MLMCIKARLRNTYTLEEQYQGDKRHVGEAE